MMVLDYDPLMCITVSGFDNEHRLSIDKMYMTIINDLSDSSRDLLPDIRTVSGWNEYVKEVQSEASDAFPFMAV